MYDASVDGTRAEFSVDHDDLNAVLAHLVELDVRALTTSPPTLEELFLRHYQGAPADGEAAVEAAHADRELEKAVR